MWFLYESDGTRAGLEYNGARYLYVYNGQGDVVALVGTNGLVARYAYDEWGRLLSVKDANGNAVTSASHIANLNPFLVKYRLFSCFVIWLVIAVSNMLLVGFIMGWIDYEIQMV